jgi:HEAT repeat protein
MCLRDISPGDKDALEPVLMSLKRGSPEVRRSLLLELDRADLSPKEIPAVVAGVVDAYKRDDSLETRIVVIRYLSHLGPVARDAVPLLEEAARSPTPELRDAAQDALAAIKPGK